MYVIAIPSYKRAKICNERTLKTLHNLGIPKEIINVFVIEEEAEIYDKTLNTEFYGGLIIGVKGIVQQRQFISDYYPDGTYIVSFDDDIESIDLSLTDYNTLDEFIRTAFETCENENAFIFGVYPVFNPFFRKARPSITIGLSFIIGAFFGYINRDDNDLRVCLTKNKDDVERTIRFYLEDGKVIRFDRIGFKTKIYGTDGGGLGKLKDRLELHKEDAIALNTEFPDLTKIKIRKNGIYEIVLTQNIVPDKPTYLSELLESETAKLYEMFSKMTVPKMSNKGGRARTFGEHRGMILGYIKARVSRKYQLSYNSRKYPLIYDEVCRIGKLICPFEFSTIQVNHNVQCPKHIDKGNIGKSVIISFGDYEGGTLFVEGDEYYTKNKPLLFDGSKLTHWNSPITSGNKYSLVFFSAN